MSMDAYSPPEIAMRVEEFGVAKAGTPWLRTVMLGILAGGFIGMGGLYFTVVTVNDDIWHRLAGGVVFSTGYMLAILAGAEVFTSNNLLAMAWASRKLTVAHVFRNWTLVLAANAVGAIGLAGLFVLSGLPESQGGAVGERAVQLAAEKAFLAPLSAFVLGVLGSLFVCLAVWVTLAGRSVTDKVVGMFLPLSALGALGLEHVAASMYFLPCGLLVAWSAPGSAAGVVAISVYGGALNLVLVALGNIVGGSLMVTLVYYFVYLRPGPPQRCGSPS